MKIKRARGGTKRDTTFMVNFSLVAIQFCHVARLQRTLRDLTFAISVDICYIAFCHIVVPRLVPFPSRRKSGSFRRSWHKRLNISLHR